MKRSTRVELGKEAVEIAERGTYTAASGGVVAIAEAVRACLEGTALFAPEALAALRDEVLQTPSPGAVTRLEVAQETTLEGIARLLADDASPVVALNFASAKNPGGGFLNGSQAQEESLARSSALYPSLLRAWDFYQTHRASPSLLYTDAMIYSPGCPVFRDDDGTLLDQPREVGFITSAAPNAGAAANTRPAEVPLVAVTLRRRAELVLALAVVKGYRRVVLGAWGCGVFRNDPVVVAEAFAGHLRGSWAGRFERVVFSVFDDSRGQETLRAFERVMG